MDWPKAKRTFVVILILLNIALFGLNQEQAKRYQLTNERENAVYQVLSQNGVSMYTNLIKKYPPMRQLGVSLPIYENEDLRRLFFEADEETKITIEFDKTIWKSKTKTLTVENNMIGYQNLATEENAPLPNKNWAQQQAEQFIKKLGTKGADFQLSNMMQLSNSYVFQYYEVFQGKKIFICGSSVVVSSQGVTEFSGSYYQIDGLFGERKELCAPDEALLTFLHSLNREDKSQGIFIEKMEIGYDFQDKAEIAEGRQLRLIPCYYIYIMNNPEPVVINGYTNELRREP